MTRAFPVIGETSGDLAPSGLVRERRVILEPLELRAGKKGSPGTIVGYAAKYEKLSKNLGGFFEKLARGCFDEVMNDDTRCLRNHGDDNLLGRTLSGTLRLLLDDAGLRYECDLPNTQVGRDTAELVSRRDMSGSSFQFNVATNGSEWNFDGDMPLRTVTKLSRLYDVAPVTDPAYDDTEVDLRSFQAALSARRGAGPVSIQVAKARVVLLSRQY